MASPARPDIGRVRTIGVPVSDQDQALRFFTDTLGFVVELDVPLPGSADRWITVTPPGAAEPSVALVATNEGDRIGVDTGIRFDTRDAESTHAHLSERGVAVGELLHWPGVPPMFTMRDRDGNQYEIVQG